MTLIVPTLAINDFIAKRLNVAHLRLKLFSNNVVPNAASVNGSFIEVSGGGYASVPLVFANWVIADGIATYPQITFTFTGVTSAPGTIYGYWIVDDDDNAFIWAENLPVVPFTPTNGSTGKITPRIQAA